MFGHPSHLKLNLSSPNWWTYITSQSNHQKMLHACVLTDGPKWDKHLPLAEFSYNNSYQESIKMSPFKALYGWPCRSPLNWSKSDERVIFGPDIAIEAEEKVKQIQVSILATQSHQKSYTNKRHSPLEFEVGDYIYLWVSPMKGVHHFGIKGKLAPRTSVCILTSTSMDQYIVKWSYHRDCQECIMCFMSPNSKDVWSLRLMLLSKTPSHWSQIWHTRHIPPRFSTNKTESCATRLLGSTSSNEMITPKMKPRGNMKNSYDPTTPSFFHQGNYPNLIHFLAFTSISGRDSFLRGRAVTPRVMANLIVIIKGLIVHQMP
jgi:hypothetical protein